MKRSLRYVISILSVFLLVLLALPMLFSKTSRQDDVSKWHSAPSTAAPEISLTPVEMPGYTGWGRPEFTLAGFMELLGSSNGESQWTVEAGKQWEQCFQCSGHPLCVRHSPTPTQENHNSWFYVRAYGPSVITGRVEVVDSYPRDVKTGSSSSKNWMYRVVLEPFDPGTYLVEVVVTFSEPPSLDYFPLERHEKEARLQQSTSQIKAFTQREVHKLYEGYMIKGFPRILEVVPYRSKENSKNSLSQTSICDIEHLIVTGVNDGMSQGRWKVTDMVRQAHHTQKASELNQVSHMDYQYSWNSIGVAMDFEFRDCRLLPLPSETLNPFRACSHTENNGLRSQPDLHIIMIGDSVMRWQHDLLVNNIIRGISTIQVDFYEIYGGYFLTQLVNGPKLRPILSRPSSAKKRVILFNTGLHDIHRLCAPEYATERRTYFTKDMEASSCASLYKMAILDMVDAIQQSVVHDGTNRQQTIAIFQTTTAAWPKYGNYGVSWDPRCGQPLPLDSGFVKEFNRIALDALRPLLAHSHGRYEGNKLVFYAVDAYWISLARPDNREIDKESHIGKKLSHPGLEVLLSIVRVWSMLVLRIACP